MLTASPTTVTFLIALVTLLASGLGGGVPFTPQEIQDFQFFTAQLPSSLQMFILNDLGLARRPYLVRLPALLVATTVLASACWAIRRTSARQWLHVLLPLIFLWSSPCITLHFLMAQSCLLGAALFLIGAMTLNSRPLLAGCLFLFASFLFPTTSLALPGAYSFAAWRLGLHNPKSVLLWKSLGLCLFGITVLNMHPDFRTISAAFYSPYFSAEVDQLITATDVVTSTLVGLSSSSAAADSVALGGLVFLLAICGATPGIYKPSEAAPSALLASESLACAVSVLLCMTVLTEVGLAEPAAPSLVFLVSFFVWISLFVLAAELWAYPKLGLLAFSCGAGLVINAFVGSLMFWKHMQDS